MRKKHRKVQAGWFLSYLLILALPILIGMAIYRVALLNSYTQAQNQNQSMMRLVMSEVDNEIVRLQNEISRLALDQTVHILAGAKGSFQRKDQMQLYTLYRDLRNIGFLEKYDEDVFIYFKNTDYIVSAKGNMSFPVYYSLYFKNSLLSEEELRACLLENHFQDIVPVQTDAGRDLLLVSTSLEADIRQGCASIGIRMKNEKLGQLLDSLRWDEQICFYVMNKDGQLVRDTGIEALNAFLGEEGAGEQDKVTIGGAPYYVSTAKSDMTGWGYSMLLPASFIKESARSIQSCAVLGLFICVFASFLLSYYLTKKNYNPLKSLISIFGSHDGTEGENEYQWLAKKVKQMIQEQTDVEEQIEQNRRILDHYALFCLLEYPYDAEDATQEYIGSREQFSGRNTVVLFSFAGEKKSADGQYVHRNSQNKFIIMNIFTELAESSFHVEMTQLGDEAAAVVCLREESPDQLKEIIENVQQMIQGWFSLTVMAVAGGVHEGVEGIHESYLEAREAEEYLALLESDIIFYQDIRNVNHKYYYPIEREEKIIGAIRAGDAAAACGYIGQILELNCQKRSISPNLWKCLLIDMFGTLLKGAEEFSCARENFEFARELSAKLSLEEAKGLFFRNITEICKNGRGKPDGRDNRLSERVKQYIEENYWNPDLNISLTADYFNRTPSYLSAVFKEQTKESLLLYINMVRIKKAEQLLKQGSSVVETAEKTGFRESGTFIRVFKKHMGVTPGQVKREAFFDNMQNSG